MPRMRKTGWEYTSNPQFYRKLDYIEKLVLAADDELNHISLCEASWIKSRVIMGLLGFCAKAISEFQPKLKEPAWSPHQRCLFPKCHHLCQFNSNYCDEHQPTKATISRVGACITMGPAQ